MFLGGTVGEVINLADDDENLFDENKYDLICTEKVCEIDESIFAPIDGNIHTIGGAVDDFFEEIDDVLPQREYSRLKRSATRSHRTSVNDPDDRQAKRKCGSGIGAQSPDDFLHPIKATSSKTKLNNIEDQDLNSNSEDEFLFIDRTFVSAPVSQHISQTLANSADNDQNNAEPPATSWKNILNSDVLGDKAV